MMHVVRRRYPDSKQFEVLEVERLQKEASDLLDLRRQSILKDDCEATKLVQEFKALYHLR